MFSTARRMRQGWAGHAAVLLALLAASFAAHAQTSADLSFTRSFEPATFVPGRTVDVTIRIKYTGGTDTRDMRLQETLPTGWQFVQRITGEGRLPDQVPERNATGTVTFRWDPYRRNNFTETLRYRVRVPANANADVAFNGTLQVTLETLGTLSSQRNSTLELRDDEEGEGEGTPEGEGEGQSTGPSLAFTRSVPSVGYTPSQILRVTVNFSYSGTTALSNVTLEETLPSGWQFVAVVLGTGATPTSIPSPNATGTLTFQWVNRPAGNFNFAYTVRVPAGTTGEQQIGGDGTFTTEGVTRDIPGLITRIQQASTATALRLGRTPSSTTYIPGRTIDLTLRLTYSGSDAITSLGLQETLPEGWSYQGVIGGTAPPIAPDAGDTGTIDFAFIDTPAFPYTLTYRVRIADTAANIATIRGKAIFSTTGPQLESNEAVTELRRPECASDCAVSSVTITAPVDGATYYVTPEVASVDINIAATTDCLADTIDMTFDATETGGAQYTIGTDAEAPYAEFATVSLATIGETAYIFRAVAGVCSAPASKPSDTVGVAIAAADPARDADGNGLPDNPFLALPAAGDQWKAEPFIAESGSTRVALAGSLRPGSGNASWLFEAPWRTGHLVQVDVPRALLQPGEIGALLVQSGPDADTALGAAAAATLAPLPEGAITSGGQFLALALVVSDDGGTSFYEAPAARLAANPMRVRMTNVGVDDDRELRLEAAPLNVETPEGRVALEPVAGGTWAPLAPQTVGPALGTVTTDITGPALVGAFQMRPAPPIGPEEVVIGTVIVGGLIERYRNKHDNKDDTPCFIATAAYGTPLHRDLDRLRAFRDHTLLQSIIGVALVDAYYSVSPTIAGSVQAVPLLASSVRFGVWLILHPPLLLGLLAAAIAIAVGLHRKGYRA